MKTLLMSIFFGSVLLNSVQSFAQAASTSSLVRADQDASICDKVSDELSGLFRSRGYDNRYYQMDISQIDTRKYECFFTVHEKVFGSMEYADHSNSLLTREIIAINDWSFDLTGKTKLKLQIKTTIPNGDKENTSEDVTTDLEIKTVLVSNRGTQKSEQEPVTYIEVTTNVFIPKSRNNLFATQLLVTGKIQYSQEDMALTKKKGVVSSMGGHYKLKKIQTRIVKLENEKIPTIFAEWYQAGANYVLKFLDDVDLVGFVIPSLGFLERTQKRLAEKW